jgi:flagellar biosynthesis GTPase FlhF
MYCSIEEAWGNNFGNSSNTNPTQGNEHFEDFKEKKKNRKKREYSKNDYVENMENSIKPTEQEYQDYMIQQRQKNSNNNNLPFVMEEEREYSRGTNYIEGDKNNKYSFTRGLSRLPDHNGPEAREITSESYQTDNYEEEEIIPQENLRHKQFMEQNAEESNNLYKTDHNLSFLLEKINVLIDKFDNKGENNNMNVALFVLTGIFIIFVLDSVFKFGKYLRE